MKFSTILAGTCAALALSSPALAQQGDGTDVEVPIHVFKPDKAPAI